MTKEDKHQFWGCIGLVIAAIISAVALFIASGIIPLSSATTSTPPLSSEATVEVVVQTAAAATIAAQQSDMITSQAITPTPVASPISTLLASQTSTSTPTPLPPTATPLPPTPTALPPTPTVDVAIIDAKKPWDVDGVAIKLSTVEFNSAATELLIMWEITNSTSKPLLVYRDPEMIQAEELSTGQELIVAKAYWNAARWDDCSHSDKVVIQPNETLSSRAYCAFYIRADYSKVKEIIVYLLRITDNIPVVKWKVEVPF